ncbi:GntR family transcriptional regulator [Thalassospira sp.]|uniref:GntR family transcriptional regulator n=1 Tax=Thalassospira sp. TaxID=1912094 RepID=UPI00273490F6|nr:GntR family transcriptional regulator [Thalassospira sp.]MDP2699783.1 GntR family transcriptional regulator [Thalassospira sp.]
MQNHPDSGFAGRLADEVFSKLLNDILSGRLPGGSIVQERRLAESLGVSRSPLRDALGRLEGQGLLVRNPRGILTIRIVTLEDYLNCLNLRLLIEPSAAALACRKMPEQEIARLDGLLTHLEEQDDPSHDALWAFDDILHDALAGASGNPFIVKAVVEMRRYTSIFERHQLTGRTKPGTDDHRAIVNALRNRDEAGVSGLMKAHLEAIRGKVLAHF